MPYTRISPNLKRAVLVAEDDAFWEHEGIDIEQLKNSIRNDIARGQIVRGGSTITQQLAKNLYLSPSRESAAQAARADHRAPARGGAVEGAHLRDLSERHRVGRRHLGRRGGGAQLLRHVRGVALTRTGGAARRRHHQPARLQSCASQCATAAPAANHPVAHGSVCAAACRTRCQQRPAARRCADEETPPAPDEPTEPSEETDLKPDTTERRARRRFVGRTTAARNANASAIKKSANG